MFRALAPAALSCAILFAASGGILFAASGGMAAEAGHGGHGAKAAAPAPRPGCTAQDTRLDCTRQATPLILPDGGMVLAWTAGGRVMAARADAPGGALGPAGTLNAQPETVDANADARIALAADGRGRVYAAWAGRDKSYNGTLALARSPDGGRTFEPARPVASDPASQRFPAMTVDGAGRLYLAWIDKRQAAAARRAGQPHRGGGLALAWSDDGAETFAHEGVALPDVCECCRIGLGLTPDGRPVALWRHIFEPNIRDHAVMVFDGRDHPGAPRKIADDDWRVDACPHVGPSLAVGAEGSLHVAWYSGGGRRKGWFAASAPAPDAAFSEPRPLGDAAKAVSHPHFLTTGNRIWLAWKEFDGDLTTVRVQVSDDAGATWSAARTAATTVDASDRPVLVGDGTRAFLSWVTAAEGWRLTELAP
jgi:hypothetical protein